jgi:hypothetical protein
MSKYLDKLRSDPRVADVSDERGFGDGYFVALKDGYDTGDEGTTIIHEYTVKALRASMARVRKVDECCDRPLPAPVGKYGCANCNGDNATA